MEFNRVEKRPKLDSETTLLGERCLVVVRKNSPGTTITPIKRSLFLYGQTNDIIPNSL